MRVVLLSLDPAVPLEGRGGTSVRLRSFAAALLRLGHEVEAIVTGSPGDRGSGDPRLDRTGLRVTRLGARDTAEGVVAALGRSHADLIVERLALFAPQGAAAASALGIRHIYEVVAPLDREAALDPAFARADDARRSLQRGLALSCGAIAASESLAQWVAALAPQGFPLRVAPNGAVPGFFEAPSREAVELAGRALGAAGPVFSFGYAGTLRPGPDFLGVLRALARLRPAVPARLVVIGDGPRRQELIAAACEAQVPLVLRGHVPHSDVPACLAHCDAMVMTATSDSGHATPFKLIEAMAAGKPIVASATASVREMLGADAHGLVVPVGDEPALLAACSRLAVDSALRAGLGESARGRARAFAWDDIVSGVLSFAPGLAMARRQRGAFAAAAR